MSRAHYLGSALILAGTAIGAGMLALPFAAVQMGFLPALLVFVLVALFMAFAGLLLLEANLAVGAGSSLYVMAGQLLGQPGKVMATLAPMGLFYALMVAYLVGGGEIMRQLLADAFALDSPIAVCILALAVLASVIVWYSTRAVDYINRFLFLLMLAAFLAAMLSLASGIQYDHLTQGPMPDGRPWAVLPIIFTSFGYHGTIPSIILYQREHRRQLPGILVLGTVLALLFYSIWLVVSLGSLGVDAMAQVGRADNGVGALVSQLSSAGAVWGYTSAFLYAFADLALLTSMLGVSLGLFDYLAGVFRQSSSASGRFCTALLTFLPPLVFALFYPDGFIAALGYAAVALSFLAILLPAAMVWRLRQHPNSSGRYRAPGGTALLVCCVLFGLVVILAQLLTLGMAY